MVEAYTANALEMLSGSVVTAAISNPTQASGVFITAGTQLFAVTLTGDITRLGDLIDTLSDARSTFTPATLIFSSTPCLCVL